ncbi:MAG: cupin domain-containing protein [Campylobacterales bacterium]|nr:cupin domain-containing protein [Campylobacterales bacterium]
MNLFDKKIPKEGEILTSLLEHKNVKIVRIVSSHTLKPTTYNQDEDEWVVIIQGSAELLMNETIVVLHQGESLFIPSKTKHSIQSVENGTIWLAVHIN